MLVLTQKFYFKNLDNNVGVIYRAADDAKKKKIKQDMLAYYVILGNDTSMTKYKIDKKYKFG